MAGVIPNAIAASLAWMNAFSDGIASNLTVYHITSTESGLIASSVSDFSVAYTTATTPSQRTSGTIAAMHTARNEAMKICRKFAQQIKVDYTISDQAKLDIGVKPPNNSNTPKPPPDEAPIINVIGSTRGSHTLKYGEVEGVEKIKKPDGVTNIQIYMVVADEEVTDQNLATLYNSYTRNPIGVAFPHADDGKVATYFARWQDARGRLGPWSSPASLRIAA